MGAPKPAKEPKRLIVVAAEDVFQRDQRPWLSRSLLHLVIWTTAMSGLLMLLFGGMIFVWAWLTH